MKAWRWLGLLLAVVLLSGCDPAQVELRYRSDRRVDEELTATVPTNRAELAVALVRSALGEDWRVDQQERDGQTRLHLTRSVDPQMSGGITVQRRLTGPLRLRYQYDLAIANPLAALAPEDPVRRALEGQELELRLRAHLPGTVVSGEGTNAGSSSGDAAVWTLKLSDLAGNPPKLASLTARSLAWRIWPLLGILIVLLVILWVIWPALIGWLRPSPEVRAQRAARKAEARERRREQDEARRQKAAARQAATAGQVTRREAAAAAKAAKRDAAAAAKAAKQAAKARPAPEPEPFIEPEPEPIREPEPLPEAEPAPEPTPEPQPEADEPPAPDEPAPG